MMIRLAVLLVVSAIGAHAQTAAPVPEPPKYSAVIRATVAAPLDSVKRRVFMAFAARTPDLDTVTIDGVHRVQSDPYDLKGVGRLEIVARIRPDTESAGFVVELRGTRRQLIRLLVLSLVGDEIPIYSGSDVTPLKRAWEELMAIATELHPTRIAFAPVG